MNFITKHERNKGKIAQKEADDKMMMWGLKFIALYFIIHILVGVIRMV